MDRVSPGAVFNYRGSYLCAMRAVSVNWRSGVFLGFIAGIERCMVLTGLVVPGSVYVGCPLGRFVL